MVDALTSGDALCPSPSGEGLILLEQLHQTKCNTPNRPYLMGKHEGLHQVVLFQPNCKLWKCPHCAIINKRKWTIRAANGVSELMAAGHDMRHVTITCHEKLNAEQTVKVLPDAWKKLSMRYRREIDFAPYYAVPERHKDMRLHLHMLTVGVVSQKWWKDNARQSGLGYQVKDRGIVDAGLAGWYSSKYLAKSVIETRWKKGFRRVRTSRNWPKLPDAEPPDGWEFLLLDKSISLDNVCAKMHNLGYTVVFGSSEQGWGIINAVG